MEFIKSSVDTGSLSQLPRDSGAGGAGVIAKNRGAATCVKSPRKWEKRKRFRQTRRYFCCSVFVFVGKTGDYNVELMGEWAKHETQQKPKGYD